jgi:hypothetical protein
MNSRESFKLTSPFGVIAQMWIALFPGSLQDLWCMICLERDCDE